MDKTIAVKAKYDSAMDLHGACVADYISLGCYSRDFLAQCSSRLAGYLYFALIRDAGTNANLSERAGSLINVIDRIIHAGCESPFVIEAARSSLKLVLSRIDTDIALLSAYRPAGHVCGDPNSPCDGICADLEALCTERERIIKLYNEKT